MMSLNNSFFWAACHALEHTCSVFAHVLGLRLTLPEHVARRRGFSLHDGDDFREGLLREL